MSGRDAARSGASLQDPDQMKGTAAERWPTRRTWARVYSQALKVYGESTGWRLQKLDRSALLCRRLSQSGGAKTKHDLVRRWI